MANDVRPVLVIGATGFLGSRVVSELRRGNDTVRGMARSPERAQHLVTDGVTVVPGDLLDASSVRRAVDGVRAVVVCVHTISPQGVRAKGQGFMAVEAQGLRHVVDACKLLGVTRVLYVTSLGVAERANSSWLRERWRTEQDLLHSGLDVTVVRPGMIVGRGGDGFGVIARGATRTVVLALAGPKQRFRTVAVEDLAADLVALMNAPQAVGEVFEVGSDDVLTMKEMVDIAATSVGRKPGFVLHVPGRLIRVLAPLIERIAKVPAGAVSGFVGDGPQVDMIGNPAAVRQLLGRIDRPFLQAIVGQI